MKDFLKTQSIRGLILLSVITLFNCEGEDTYCFRCTAIVTEPGKPDRETEITQCDLTDKAAKVMEGDKTAMTEGRFLIIQKCTRQ